MRPVREDDPVRYPREEETPCRSRSATSRRSPSPAACSPPASRCGSSPARCSPPRGACRSRRACRAACSRGSTGRARRRVAVRHDVHGPAGRRLGGRRGQPARRHRHLTVTPDRPFYITRGCWIANSHGVEIQTRWGGAQNLFGGEGGFVLQATGQGEVVLGSYGAVDTVELGPGEAITIDSGHVVAYDAGVQSRLRRAVEGRSVQSLKSRRGVRLRLRRPGPGDDPDPQPARPDRVAHHRAAVLPQLGRVRRRPRVATMEIGIGLPTTLPSTARRWSTGRGGPRSGGSPGSPRSTASSTRRTTRSPRSPRRPGRPRRIGLFPNILLAPLYQPVWLAKASGQPARAVRRPAHPRPRGRRPGRRLRRRWTARSASAAG